jgi:hypothetical protein
MTSLSDILPEHKASRRVRWATVDVVEVAPLEGELLLLVLLHWGCVSCLIAVDPPARTHSKGAPSIWYASSSPFHYSSVLTVVPVSHRAEGGILDLGMTTERLTCSWKDNEPRIAGVSLADDQDIGRPVSISIPHSTCARADVLPSVSFQLFHALECRSMTISVALYSRMSRVLISVATRVIPENLEWPTTRSASVCLPG